MDERVRLWRSWELKNWCFWTVVLEKTLESPLDCKEIQPVHSEGGQPWDFFGRNDAKASKYSSTLATSCKELTHWKRLWCWEGLWAGEGDDRGWDGWMASLTRWTWVWENYGSWWWTGRPGVLWFMESQRVGHGWATELTIGTSKSARLKPNSPSFPSKPAPPVFLISVALPSSQSWKPEYRSFFPFQKQAATKAIQLERMIFSTSGARTTGHPHGRKMNLDTDF